MQKSIPLPVARETGTDCIKGNKDAVDVQGRTNIAGAGCAGAMLVTFSASKK
jgi:hypothetical protein